MNPQGTRQQGFLGDVVHRGQPSGAHKGKKRKIKTGSGGRGCMQTEKDQPRKLGNLSKVSKSGRYGAIEIKT